MQEDDTVADGPRVGEAEVDDRGGEVGILLLETVPPIGLAVVVVERTVDGLYWLRRRLD